MVLAILEVVRAIPEVVLVIQKEKVRVRVVIKVRKCVGICATRVCVTERIALLATIPV